MAPTVHHHHGTTIITIQFDHSCHHHHHRTFELLLIEIPLFAATVIVQHLGWNAKGVRNKQEGEIPVKKFKNCIRDTNTDTNTNTNTDTNADTNTDTNTDINGRLKFRSQKIKSHL